MRIAALMFFYLCVSMVSVRAEELVPVVLDPSSNVELINLAARDVEIDGKSGLELTAEASGECLAILRNQEMRAGVIECEMIGKIRDGAAGYARGFVGVAFRLQENAKGYDYECIYLRPTNSRANNQLRRNRSVQYSSEPEHPWRRLREESPGIYETYVDVAPDSWTHMRVEFAGTSAKLFINHAEQPTLVVSDLKLGDRTGGIAIWSEETTLAYVRDVRVAVR